MGIQGLLGALKGSATRTAHLSDFAGLTAAVDTYAWLHRGTYGCATELCVKGDSNGYIDFCMGRIRLLQENNVTPLMVFDGANLPSKAGTEKGRAERRKDNLEKGKKLHAEGKRAASHTCFTKAVDVTPQMAQKLIRKLKKENIQFVVAPYEADAQLAYLNKEGHADFVISEDSDCIPFGCTLVFFKLDRFGRGDVIDTRTLTKRVPGSASSSRAGNISLARFNKDMILDMCILAGCDYLPSISGMGIKRASQYAYKYKKTDRILRGIRFEASLVWPANYEKDFKKARVCFRHQRVYCPKKKALVHLNPLPEGLRGRTLDFCGPPVEDDISQGVANGVLHPSLHTPWPEKGLFAPPQMESARCGQGILERSAHPKSSNARGIFDFFKLTSAASKGQQGRQEAASVSQQSLPVPKYRVRSGARFLSREAPFAATQGQSVRSRHFGAPPVSESRVSARVEATETFAQTSTEQQSKVANASISSQSKSPFKFVSKAFRPLPPPRSAYAQSSSERIGAIRPPSAKAGAQKFQKDDCIFRSSMSLSQFAYRTSSSSQENVANASNNTSAATAKKSGVHRTSSCFTSSPRQPAKRMKMQMPLSSKDSSTSSAGARSSAPRSFSKFAYSP